MRHRLRIGGREAFAVDHVVGRRTAVVGGGAAHRRQQRNGAGADVDVVEHLGHLARLGVGRLAGGRAQRLAGLLAGVQGITDDEVLDQQPQGHAAQGNRRAAVELGGRPPGVESRAHGWGLQVPASADGPVGLSANARRS